MDGCREEKLGLTYGLALGGIHSWRAALMPSARRWLKVNNFFSWRGAHPSLGVCLGSVVSAGRLLINGDNREGSVQGGSACLVCVCVSRYYCIHILWLAVLS